MKPETKSAWIRDQRCGADDAIRSLQAAKKQRVSEYDERLRKLKDYAEVLFIKQTDSQQMELLEPGEVLTPELTSLIKDPLNGLD